ncbi:dehydrogenase/reductase SDR family member 13 [Sphaerodactylus townsendi]|uniref:dehydrogenase/reductase SDR family member 13 n=1 Tax=Sphaerodactylus townsendi TaxID=933632 RepID=UPI0020267372|nr:dehydrogenase/reductase SDR family member 13 [Sphaerodactylus townsendi]
MMAVLMLTGLAGFYVWLYYNFLQAAKCLNRRSLRGKTVLITGANRGIGEETALDLARRGARIILACRNKAQAESVASNIRMETGNSEVFTMRLDLADLSSVRAFADEFLRSEPRLDILINNAGIQDGGRSADGFNLTFQVNHLSHFLLTHLLLDRLKCCAPSRVVVLASSAHQAGKIDFKNIHKPVHGFLKYFQAYCHSKLANILFTRELANRLEGTNVTCYAVHPGLVATEIMCKRRVWMKPLVFLARFFIRDAVEGAQTSIYCATQDGIEKYSGHYFADCKPEEPYPQARDDAVAKKLWAFSEKLLGLAEQTPPEQHWGD